MQIPTKYHEFNIKKFALKIMSNNKRVIFLEFKMFFITASFKYAGMCLLFISICRLQIAKFTSDKTYTSGHLLLLWHLPIYFYPLWLYVVAILLFKQAGVNHTGKRKKKKGVLETRPINVSETDKDLPNPKVQKGRSKYENR